MVRNILNVRIISVCTLIALLIAFFIPGTAGSRIIAAILLPVCTVVAAFLARKRKILSINKNQVLLIMTLIALLYVMGIMLSGFYFGFALSLHPFTLKSLFGFILPASLIIASSEAFRHMALASEDRFSGVLAFIVCIISDAVIFYGAFDITSFNYFMDFFGMALLPSIVANVAYHYISRLYGAYPNVVFRLLTTLYPYLIPYEASVPPALLAIIKLLLPICIYAFLSALYENKQTTAVKKRTSKIAAVIFTVFTLAVSICLSMLVSNQFNYGTLVIGTESMTGEINKGDAVIFEKYETQTVTKNTVVVFEKQGITIVHRVVDIERINGQNRYVTRGDANDAADDGYITDANIIGIVKMKISYVGYPTIWLNNIFNSGKEVTPDV